MPRRPPIVLQRWNVKRVALLAELGFDQPDATAEELARLAQKRGTPFQQAQPLGAALVTELAAAPDPDQALRHLADLYGGLVHPHATSELLAQSPRTTRLLISLFGSSDYLSRQLLTHPELIDQLVLRGAAALVRERADLRDDLANRLRPLSPLDVEAALTELRRFRNEEVLRIALHDVAGALAVEQVSRQLSDLADACVDACFALARAEIEKRYGKRRRGDARCRGPGHTALGPRRARGPLSDAGRYDPRPRHRAAPTVLAVLRL